MACGGVTEITTVMTNGVEIDGEESEDDEDVSVDEVLNNFGDLCLKPVTYAEMTWDYVASKWTIWCMKGKVLKLQLYLYSVWDYNEIKLWYIMHRFCKRFVRETIVKHNL